MTDDEAGRKEAKPTKLKEEKVRFGTCKRDELMSHWSEEGRGDTEAKKKSLFALLVNLTDSANQT